MRISKIITCLLFSYVANIYAEEDQVIAIAPQPVETRTAITPDDSAILSQCESEIRALTGRVEVLEHNILELQKNHVATPLSPVGEAPPAYTAVQASVDNTAEKRDYDTALAGLKDSKFAEAEIMFDNFIQKYPSSQLISNAYFWHAESFYRRGEFDKAAVHYLKGYKQFPKAAKAADSLFKLALSLGEIKKTKEACAILAKLEEEFKQRPASSIKRAYDAKMKFGCK
jgi:tol-pal system protein YbgF